jgi:hypothetical protein
MRTSNEKATEQRRDERARWGDPARVRCISPGGFFDGNLKGFFEQIGQDPKIDTNEIRELPAWLLERCINSGGQFEVVL